MTKLFSAVAAIALFGAGLAYAQDAGTQPAADAAAAAPAVEAAPAIPVPATACPAHPAAPALPDGTVAKGKDMEAGNATFTAWIAQSDASINCLKAEREAAAALANSRTKEANAAINARNDVQRAWVASAEAYNAKLAQPKKKR